MININTYSLENKLKYLFNTFEITIYVYKTENSLEYVVFEKRERLYIGIVAHNNLDIINAYNIAIKQAIKCKNGTKT